MKKILAFAPVMPQASETKGIAATLSFLPNNVAIDFIDPLFCISMTRTAKSCYQYWKNYIQSCLPHYDAFFGFSFGGIILQQCFSVFEEHRKPLLLFSTPSFADSSLKNKLSRVILLAQENKLEKALLALYQDVFYPNRIPEEIFTIEDKELAIKRLSLGLQLVLDTDSRGILRTQSIEHLHLIGEYSNLVNGDNVVEPQTGTLLMVPNAGMRVLQDNQAFCKKVILERLNCPSV